MEFGVQFFPDVGPEVKPADRYWSECLDLAALADGFTHVTIGRAGELEAAFSPMLDRPVRALSPVERAVLLLGAFELGHCPDVPYRVVINEAVELAKEFGGTDGHKYVNGVLDKAAVVLRPAETSAARR